ncbi:sensor domain-containing diguanylate cyclase [Acidovorax carolinensis]|uniref:Sensor domain-containing diguanylate cyclase n=1 Tax=Acidovorax carolinensis TaxID=553814 RepID=A0A240UHK0_9BURK|nr:diguanylate cyclase [Acidovorax carolinensis]ART56678.1 sensor domain-containing diguanylate cyclase [Acidovorax carolinensis]ART60948.1 sensor domain-containing diguanylate cyclase [Acidovorax carolinensis]
MRSSATSRLILLAALLSLGIGGLFARSIWTLREEAWRNAERTKVNLVRTLDQNIARTMESFDLSIQGVVEGIGDPRVMALPVEMRQRALFDNSLRVQGIGSILVLDRAGNVVLDSEFPEPRKANFADRDYVKVFESGAHTGLYVGAPVRARLTGLQSLPVSRAYYGPDGQLAGVVVGTIRLAHFQSLFEALNLGPDGSLNLFRSDGIVIARFPFSKDVLGRSLAGTPNMRIFQSARSGVFTGRAAFDNVERLYAFRHVGDYPLMVNVAQSVDAILAGWYRSAWLLGGFALLLMAACVGLAGLFARELRRRQQVSGQLQQVEHDLRTILNNLPSMIGYWDRNQYNRFANHAYLDWFGMTPDQLRGKHLRELLGGDLYEKSRPYLEQALQGHPQIFERTRVDNQGAARHSIVSYVPDVDGDDVRGIFVQVTDITERKHMEEALFEEKERMRLTLKAIGDAVVCTDAQGVVTYLNPVAQRLTGWQGFDAAGRSVDEVIRLQSPDGQAPQPSPLRLALQQQKPVEPTRGVVLHRTSGQRFDVEESASPITDRHGQITGAVTVLRDVTDTVAMQERMAHLAQYDALTDLPNRVLLQDRARQALAQARRDGKSVAVMYIDLDGFKQVNDTLGHDVGDELLVQLAQRLTGAVRASDTVCRQGGDEFVVLLPGIDTTEQASHVARKIMAACSAPYLLNGRVLSVELSGGIALFPEHGQDFETLSRHADAAMYAAKHAGRRQFRVYAGVDAEPVRVALEDDQASICS